jgi:hypothetical protein
MTVGFGSRARKRRMASAQPLRYSDLLIATADPLGVQRGREASSSQHSQIPCARTLALCTDGSESLSPSSPIFRPFSRAHRGAGGAEHDDGILLLL